MKYDSYYPLFGWLIIVGLITFGGFLLWEYGFVSGLLTQDKTYLSVIILILFLAVCVYLGGCAWHLSRQTQCARKFYAHIPDLPVSDLHESDWLAENTRQHGWALMHYRLLNASSNDTAGSRNESTQAYLVERVHRAHSSGWFFSDLLLRLGLIGTVIGFVLMLGAVYELKQEGIQALQQLLAHMGSGMQVALYTTLTGLGAAMLIGVQCHWLDRCADRLVSMIIEMTALHTGSRV